MRIDGVWGKFEAPYVRALFISPKLDIRKNINFLIDSGASRTSILDNDAALLGIDHNLLEKYKGGTTGIGGVVDTYIIRDAVLMFKTTTGLHSEKLEVFVIKHTPRDKGEEERIKSIPSLLGRDLINRYSLILNRRKGIVTITDENE